jgi:large subunit ribosomal protein L13
MVRRFPVYEDIYRQARRNHARLVRRRRRGSDPRSVGDQIADTLRGKRKPQYTPHVDTGDFVVVVNAEKIVVTGNKLDQKRYYRHSGYPGGLKSRTLREQLDRRPTEVIRTAVKGMLPRNRLARQQLTKLKVYAGPEHPHGPQNPQPLNLEQ